MPFLAFIIAIAVIVVLVFVALFFGILGAAARGPHPHEGSKDPGHPR